MEKVTEMLHLLNIEILTTMDYFTLAVSFLMFVFAKKIIHKTDTSGSLIEHYSHKVTILRSFNVVLFSCYIFSIFFNKTFGEVWSQSYLIILLGLVGSHIINYWVLEKYGDHVTVDEITRFTDNSASKILRVGLIISVVFICIIWLLFIWDLKEQLQNGSVFGIIALLLFTTKEYWMEEVFASFTITSNNRFKRGNIIGFEGEYKFYVILETKFIGTRLKNLKTDVEVHIPNSKLVRDNVQLYSLDDVVKTKKQEENGNKKIKKEFKAIKQYLHFNIGYNSNFDSVDYFFKKVMEDSQKESVAIGKNFSLNINNNGDHAVTWELIYYVQNPYQILNVRNIINLHAFKNQNSCDIDLSTPITHKRME